MTPRSAAAMRAALESRINAQAASDGVDPARVRRRLVFQRLTRRLAVDEGWVLKGAYLLETRLGRAARATRDLDLATPLAEESDPASWRSSSPPTSTVTSSASC